MYSHELCFFYGKGGGVNEKTKKGVEQWKVNHIQKQREAELKAY